MKLTKNKDILTLLLIVANHISWVFLFIYFNDMPLPLLVLFGSITMAFQSSLQHELIHNHPFRSQNLNDFLGHFCCNPWLPYALYKESHIRHHACEQYSNPHFDPETFYVSKKTYDDFSKPTKLLFDFNQTLIGRILIGPLISFFWVVTKEVRRLTSGEYSLLLTYLPHGLVWFSLLTAMHFLDISFWKFLFCVSYPGYSLILIRSFVEHRFEEDRNHQTCIVEAHPFFSILFLNNNLHLVHHHNMDIPWYDLPKTYRQQKTQWQQKNGRYVYRSYWQIFKNFGFRKKADAWVNA